MALTVETGAGLPDADALVSLDYLKAHLDKTGRDYSSYSDDALEQAIRRGTSNLCDSHDWEGLRTKGRNQALAFPRSSLYDREGYGIDSDEIPVEIMTATCELSWQEATNPHSLNPVYTASDLVKSEKVGDLEVEYALASTSAEAQRPELLAVQELVRPFLKRGEGGHLSGRVYRGA